MQANVLKQNWIFQIRILWWGYAILMGSAAMSLPYWPVYLSELLPNSPVKVRYWSGMIYLAPFITGAVFAPFWGWIGDRFGYKAMLIRACSGLACTQFLILFTNNVWALFAIRLLQGALAGVIVATQAWALSITPAKSHGSTIGKLQSALAIGELIGPLLGGAITDYFGFLYVFLFSTIVCVIITLIFLFNLNDHTVNKPVAVNDIQNKEDKLSSTWGAISWNNALLFMLFAIIFTQIARSIFTPFFALYVNHQIHGSNIIIGILSAIMALSIFIFAPLWGKYYDVMIKNKQQEYLSIAIMLFITALLQTLHSYTSSLSGLLILRFSWGLCISGLTPILLKILLNNCISNIKGTMLGVGNGLIKAGNLIGTILGATILAQFSYSDSFLIMSGIYMCAGIMMLLILFESKIK